MTSATKSNMIGMQHFLVYGILLFSGISNILFEVGGLYIFELALVCAAIYSVLFPNSLYYLFVECLRENSHELFMLALCLTFFMLVGWATGGSLANAYTDFRSNFVVIFGYFFASYCLRNERGSYLSSLGVATGVCSLIYWAYMYKYGLIETKFAVPVISCVIAALIYRENFNYKMAVASILLLVLMSAVAFYRQYWLYVVVVMVLLFKNSSKLKVGRFNLFPVLLLSMIPILLIGYEFFFNVVAGSESLYIQSFGKTQDLLNYIDGYSGLSESDAIRAGYFEYMAQFWYKILLPHGLGYKSYFDAIDPWFGQYLIEANTIDSLFFYINFHYGLVVGLPLILYFLYSLITNPSYNIFEKISLLGIFSVIMLFDGAQATVIPRSFWLGAYVAFISTRRKIRN
ncbi:hypothetical protein [Curvibacter lanceolatus]|uniref:hypothetical protein n=1 Tax=Curvibacter lanceolatus TaxID=86182 RepID=UPI0012F7E8E7|nr:hypothetical protein [Curvibacter lanceolatus]